ncbi:MAG: SAM-dependent methyltransferase, partial [Alphaproteobacteria bacterium]|nr:SAM-dependent methyltransferase [Alphaproteobacteria bacterium]
MLLAHLARGAIRSGRLTIVDARGCRHQLGSSTGPHVVIRLHDRLLPYQLCWNPYLHLGEAYMDGRLTIEEGDLRTFLEILTVNEHHLERHRLIRSLEHLRCWMRLLQQINPIRRARVNVA